MGYQKGTTYWLTVSVRGSPGRVRQEVTGPHPWSPGPFVVTYGGSDEFLGELHHQFNLKDEMMYWILKESLIGPGRLFQVDDEPPVDG